MVWIELLDVYYLDLELEHHHHHLGLARFLLHFYQAAIIGMMEFFSWLVIFFIIIILVHTLTFFV